MAMPSIVKILRVAADPNRLRILLLLKAEELSVAELQEILVMGQSTISTHLSQLKQAGWSRIAAPARAASIASAHQVRAMFLHEASCSRRSTKSPKPPHDQAAAAPRRQKAPGQDARLLRQRRRPPRQRLRSRQILEKPRRSPPPPHAADGHRRSRRRRRKLLTPSRQSAPQGDRRRFLRKNDRGRPRAGHSSSRQERRLPPRRHGRTAHRRCDPSISSSFRSRSTTRCIPSAHVAEAGAFSGPADASSFSISPSIASKRRARCTPTSGSASAKRSSKPCSGRRLRESKPPSSTKIPKPHFQTLLAVAHKRADISGDVESPPTRLPPVRTNRQNCLLSGSTRGPQRDHCDG